MAFDPKYITMIKTSLVVLLFAAAFANEEQPKPSASDEGILVVEFLH